MQVLTDDGLKIYDTEIKKYFSNKIGVTVEKSEINGNIKINGEETTVFEPNEYYVEY